MRPESLYLHSAHVGGTAGSQAQITHPRNQLHHLDSHTPIERQIANLLLFNRHLHRGALSLYKLHWRLNHDLLLYVADGKAGLHALLFPRDQREAIHLPRCKPRRCNVHGIGPRWQRHHLEIAAIVGGRRLRQPGFDIGNGNRRAHNQSAARILDDAENRAFSTKLGQRKDGRPEQQDAQEGERTDR